MWFCANIDLLAILLAEACLLQAITLGAIGVAAVADIYDRNATVR